MLMKLELLSPPEDRDAGSPAPGAAAPASSGVDWHAPMPCVRGWARRFCVYQGSLQQCLFAPTRSHVDDDDDDDDDDGNGNGNDNETGVARTSARRTSAPRPNLAFPPDVPPPLGEKRGSTLDDQKQFIGILVEVVKVLNKKFGGPS